MPRILIGVGLALVSVGVLLLGLERLGLGAGRLPGDFLVRGRHWTFFAPLGTSLILSVLLTLALYLFARMRR